MPSTEHLERAANVAIIIAAIACCAVWLHYGPNLSRSARPTPVGRPAAHAPGDVLPEAIAVSPDPHSRVLLMFVNSHCQYCTASMSFYQQLVKARDDRANPMRLIALSRERVDVLQSYLAAHGVRADGYLSIGEHTADKLALTPTLLLVDSERTIQRVWTGRLNEAAQREVLDLMN